MRGCKLVFADIDPETLNIDLAQVEALVTSRTRLVAPVNYAGRPSVSAEFVDKMNLLGVDVIEDNAHGLFGSVDDRPLGTFGRLSTLSFHETKNVTCGEGGALVINDPELFDAAEIIREKGTNRSQFFRGTVDKYTWIALGSSYLCSDLNAAVLLAQLEDREEIQSRRQRAWAAYNLELAQWADSIGARRPASQEQGNSHHMFEILMPDLATRTRFLAHMSDRCITATFHHLPSTCLRLGRPLATPLWVAATRSAPQTDWPGCRSSPQSLMPRWAASSTLCWNSRAERPAGVDPGATGGAEIPHCCR